ncbi:radical SAM protein [Polyangium aurulentum]|uniref:radical SAM protein n=1 Tax=Polyangium aurulentum TaxID=2567896 RepID=UPI00146BC855|nr:radical SAM protein [Polyangium aurulentum]UQA59776.1 radical SAM protein [Polyangium aurulentum]
MTSFATMKKEAAFTAGLLRKRPFSCLVQVTNRCNMECSFCDFWPNPAPPRQELSLEDYQRLGDELGELGCFLISVEGGEPLARPDIVEIVRALSRKHITALFTNGWYVTPEKARALFDAGLVHANVSIDYPEASRHDGKRRLAGATDRAWKAVDILRDAAPRGGKQVHVMTVLMEDNWRDLEALLQQSAAHGVGHQTTLLSISGFRRGKGPDQMPPASIGEHLVRLWDKYPHLRFFRDYFTRMEAFLGGGAMPTCNAGVQGFNIDHVGNVSPCIERIDQPVGNVREERLSVLHARLAARREEIDACQQCWTACRGVNQALGGGGSARSFLDLGTRMRTS